MTPLRARAAAIVLVLTFLAVVSGALSRRIPDELDTPIAPLSLTSGPQLTLVPGLTSQSGLITRQIDFRVGDRQAFSGASELRLLVEGYSLDSSMRRAAFELAGSDCAFTAGPRKLAAASVLVLAKDRPCEAPPGEGSASLTVTIEAATPAVGKFGLHTYPTAGRRDLLATEGSSPATPVGHLTTRRSERSERVAVLLAWMWGIPESGLWIRIAIAGGCLLGGAWFACGTTQGFKASAAAFGFAAGLGLMYAVIVPPLQAADEPDHLLSLGALIGRSELAAAEGTWARRVHFDRIAFRPMERFTPAHKSEPWSRAWADTEVFAEDVANRSVTASRYWTALSPLLPSTPEGVVLFVRMTNAVVFGLAFAAGTSVLAAAGASLPIALAFVLLTLPALPFFGSYLTESTWTLVGFVLVAYAGAAMVGNAATVSAGGALGVALALIYSGSRSGWPMGGVIAAICAVRVVVGSRSRQDSLRFWAMVALPSIILVGSGFLRVPTPSYNQWHLTGLDPAAPFNSGMLLLATALGATAGYGAERLRERIGGLGRSLTFFRLGVIGLAAWFMATLVASLFVPMPTIPWLDGNATMTMKDYLRQVLASTTTIARVGKTDFFVWDSFLAGFGWLDVFLPHPAITAVTLALVVSAIVTLVAVARERDGRRSAALVLIFAGVLLAITGSAVGAYAMNRNLHGRYLQGPYLSAIAVLCGGLALLPSSGRFTSAARAVALLAVMLVSQGFSLSTVVARYFR